MGTKIHDEDSKKVTYLYIILFDLVLRQQTTKASYMHRHNYYHVQARCKIFSKNTSCVGVERTELTSVVTQHLVQAAWQQWCIYSAEVQGKT